MPGTSNAVFLSYASEDAEAAGRIATALRAAGVEVWFDKTELRGGDAWDRQIRKQIQECRLFVPVISANSERREEGYFRREWKLAVDRTHDMAERRAFLVPVAIDDTPDRGASVPEKFHELQWTRLPAGETAPAFVERVQRLLSPEASPARGAGPPVSSSSTTVQRSNRSLPPLWGFKPLLWAIGAVLATALAYFVADRFGLSKRSAIAASNATPALAAPPEKSIAVLPFVDLSAKHDQEYFASGIAEEVLDRLAKVPSLRVVGRTSSFQFEGKSTDPASIGAALGVAYLLEGSVRKEGEHVRVAAQLIEARTGSQRWSDRYDSDVADVLQMQDNIAIELARALQTAVEVDTTPRSSVKSPEVLDAYLRGEQAFNRGTQDGYEAAVANFQQALSLDPTFGRAASSLARTHAYIGAVGWLPPRVAFERAREAARLAQRLDPNSPMPHIVMAEVHVEYDFDWDGADRELQQAFALGPKDSYGAQTASELAAARGRWDEARQLGIEAVALDPLSAEAHELLGYVVYLRSGQLAEAEQSFRRALQIRPEYDVDDYFLGEALMLQGHPEAALAEFRKATADDGRAVGSAMAYFAAGRKGESDAQLAVAIRQNASDWPQGIASVYAFRGENDQAFKWLDRAYEAHDHLYIFKDDPLMKKLQDDPRYKAFLRKMNLPE
jgi:TolB-like protein/predicted Zn-dependent protease